MKYSKNTAEIGGVLMFTFEYSFYPKCFTQSELDTYENSMQWFLSALVKNGQSLFSFQNTVKLQTHYACRIVVPEMDSLEKKYWNVYCKKFYQEVIEMSAKEPTLQYIGENYDVQDCCTCQSPSYYILHIEYASYTTPILCGDCFQAVPLYKLPKTYENEEYYDLLAWQRVYEACDGQFTEGIGERFGYRMMHNPKSALSQEGIRICRFLEERMKVPFYYFLFQYYRKNKPVCPLCGKDWKHQEHDKVQYDYVCHTCRLVSDDIG